MFSLYKVCGIAFSIKASCHESSAWPPAVLPRDQDEIYLRAIDIGRAYEHVPEDARHLDRGVLDAVKFTQQVVIEGKLGYVIDAVREVGSHQKLVLVGDAEVGAAVALQGLALILDFGKGRLDAFCEIHIVREVECPFILNFLHHIYIWLVFRIYLHVGGIRKRNEQKLLNPVDVGSKNLANKRSLFNYNEIAIDGQLNITEHSIYFL